jgi:hypothetical protein
MNINGADIQIWGAVSIDNEDFYEEEMLTIDPKRRLLYGIDWVYAGDAFFNECGIEVLKRKDGKHAKGSFYGRKALPEMLAWIQLPVDAPVTL